MNTQSAKILVTGATGFLGSVLVARLAASGHNQIRCFTRHSSDRTRLEELRTQYPWLRLESFCGELESRTDAARALDGVEIVYHLAAALRGSPADIFFHTVVGSKRLLEAMEKSGPRRVVLVSSFGVYGVAERPRGSIVDEQTPLEQHPERRDPYSYAKLRQELLFREAHERQGFELTILRPGVIYGPGGGRFSTRVGLKLPGLFLHFGGENVLPLSYVDNCADAIVAAGDHADAAGEVYNVHDDDLPTSRAYLRRYQSEVGGIRPVRIPYFAAMAMSRMVEKYHRHSKGQLPAILTPYKSASLWRGNGFCNRKLKSLGWRQAVPTEEGLRRTFAAFRAESGNKRA